MKHIFVINPCAGSGKGAALLKEKIKASALDFEIYETKGHRDAVDFVRSYCENCAGELRFYACGGDGTAKEVAEGIIAFPNASMSIYPIGSGNDFVKYFGGEELFKNIENVAGAENAATDIIHITHDGGETYSINVCNFGFEAYVADVMNRVRRKPVIGGGNSYTTGIICGLFNAMKTHAKVYADGVLLNDSGVLMLGTVANGSYEGGGYNAAPLASVNDGMLEVCLVKPLSVITVARLIGLYKKGEHLRDERFKKYVTYVRAKKVELVSDKPITVGLDGEIIETKRLCAKVCEGAVNFAAPDMAVQKV